MSRPEAEDRQSVLRCRRLQCPRQGVRRVEHPGYTGREQSVNVPGGSVKGGEGVER